MTGGEPSSGVAEFGNSSVIRWGDNVPNLEELIVTTVIRDAMLASFHSAMGAAIQPKENQIVINWLPDPTTLLHILASVPKTSAKSRSCIRGGDSRFWISML